MKHTVQLVLITALILVAAMSEARTVRATELSGLRWEDLSAKDGDEVVIEFREGDEIPVHFAMSGDFAEMNGDAANLLHIKKNFYLKIVHDQVAVSLDGAQYKPLPEVMTGTLQAGANESGGIANALNIMLTASQKK